MIQGPGMTLDGNLTLESLSPLPYSNFELGRLSSSRASSHRYYRVLGLHRGVAKSIGIDFSGSSTKV
ncbi:hypothetical protein FRB94_003829 [Tulasnella sp. JGI-2019a]|nr:hypothetical protein FRB94_003829 [Tulasnella sp. JGI-2019a]KAG9031340.1 hypothetical protein FRB95_002838 [Tulasnella sp. JGI-2019a]